MAENTLGFSEMAKPMITAAEPSSVDSTVRAQPGPQEMFLTTPADIAIYGGAAFGGKSFSLLLEPMRHKEIPNFHCVTFRRTTEEIRKAGALWDESENVYPLFGGIGSAHHLLWEFPSGAAISFAHMQHEKDRFSWHGAQIPLIQFDELTSFTEKQFFYMMSRNRSGTGIPGYIRATCNPDCDSWVARLIAWWINQDTGYAIPERSGVVRWFVRMGDKIEWGSSKKELKQRFGDKHQPKSLTFIPSKITDNKIGMDKDPSYLGNLMAMPTVERERLLEGNWKIRPAAGLIFKREWFEIVDAAPGKMRSIRVWDRAATEKREGNDPDYTAGIRVGTTGNGIYYVTDLVKFRAGPGEVLENVKATCSRDTNRVELYLLHDPGQAGKVEAHMLSIALANWGPRMIPVPQINKVSSANNASAQAQARNIKLVRAAWNDDFLTSLENFPDAAHDDDVDALVWTINTFVNVGNFAWNRVDKANEAGERDRISFARGRISV